VTLDQTTLQAIQIGAVMGSSTLGGHSQTSQLEHMPNNAGLICPRCQINKIVPTHRHSSYPPCCIYQAHPIIDPVHGTCSHADTCMVGANCNVLEYTVGRQCITGFSDTHHKLTNICSKSPHSL